MGNCQLQITHYQLKIDYKLIQPHQKHKPIGARISILLSAQFFFPKEGIIVNYVVYTNLFTGAYLVFRMFPIA